MRNPFEEEPLIQVFFGGDPKVGKTTLVSHLRDGESFNADHIFSATIGSDFAPLRDYILRSHNVRLQVSLVDSAGDTKFNSVQPIYLRRAEAVFLVFSLTDQASFDCLLPRWKQLHEEYEKRYRQNMDEPITAGDFAPDRIVILIGNKLDEVEKNPDKRKVTTEQGQNLAVALGAKHYYERSALYDTDMGHLRMPLDIALRYVVEKRQKQAASWSRDLVNQNKGKPTNPLIQLAWHDNTEDKASLNKREEVYGIHSLGAQQQQQQQKACCHS